MSRKSLSRGGRTALREQDCGKLASHFSTSGAQTNRSFSKCRRSLRLKELSAIYGANASNANILSSKHLLETSLDACSSSLIPVKSEKSLSLYNGSHDSPRQNNNAFDKDSDDESNISITLMDLVARYKIKKRKASEGNRQANVDIQKKCNALVIPNEDVELEETISSFKAKKIKSSSSREKLDKLNKTFLQSLSVTKKAVQAFSLDSVTPERELDEGTFKGAVFHDLSLDSEFDSSHTIDNVNAKMKEFAELTPIAVGNPDSSVVIKMEVVEACLDLSDDGICALNSIPYSENDIDNESLNEVFNNVTETDDLGGPDNVVSNIKGPFTRDAKQCEDGFSSSTSPTLEKYQIPIQEVNNIKDKHMVACSTEWEYQVPNVGLKFKHHRSVHKEVPQNDCKHQLQSEESMSFDKEDMPFIVSESFQEFHESDCAKLTSSLESDRWLKEHKRSSFVDETSEKKTVSVVPEFKTSYNCKKFGVSIAESGVSLGIESNGYFIDGMKLGYVDRNSFSDTSSSYKNLDLGCDEDYSIANKNCSELLSQSMLPSTCISTSFSQTDSIILPDDTLLSVNAPYSSIEARSPNAVPDFKDEQQDSRDDEGVSHGYVTTTNYLVDVHQWAPQADKLPLSTEVLMLKRCSQRLPCCVKDSELSDAKSPCEIACHCPTSQLKKIDIRNMNHAINNFSKSESSTIQDFSASSSLESCFHGCVERQKNMQTTGIEAEETMFGGNRFMEAERSPKKLLSHRKDISPNSQEKLLRALDLGGLDDVVKLSHCMRKLCFDKGATKKPVSSFLDNGEVFMETEGMIKKPKSTNRSPPEATKGILKLPESASCNSCCLKNSSFQAQTHDAILFSQRQMQDTENIAAKLLKELNSMKSIVEEAISLEGPSCFPSKFSVDEIRSATKHATKLETTTKKWLAMMAKDCNRFCKIMRLAENKLASPLNDDIHRGRKKIIFADEVGGVLCQVKHYEQQPVAFIFPKI